MLLPPTFIPRSKAMYFVIGCLLYGKSVDVVWKNGVLVFCSSSFYFLSCIVTFTVSPGCLPIFMRMSLRMPIM